MLITVVCGKKIYYQISGTDSITCLILFMYCILYSHDFKRSLSSEN